MERNCNRRAHVNIVAYARALWAATKKKRRNTAIAIFIPMVLLEMVAAVFRGFGSPTGNGGGGSVIYVIYPLFILVCCIAASFYLFFVPFVLCWFANTCYCYYYKLNFYSTSRVLACWNARHFVGSNRISARNGGGCFSSVVL